MYSDKFVSFGQLMAADTTETTSTRPTSAARCVGRARTHYRATGTGRRQSQGMTGDRARWQCASDSAPGGPSVSPVLARHAVEPCRVPHMREVSLSRYYRRCKLDFRTSVLRKADCRKVVSRKSSKLTRLLAVLHLSRLHFAPYNSKAI